MFTTISIPPKVATAYSIALLTASSERMSHWIPRALPPASSISLQAVAMVPGSLGWGVTVLAKITILAPSLANLFPMANPIPLDAPLMTTVSPLASPTF